MQFSWGRGQWGNWLRNHIYGFTQGYLGNILCQILFLRSLRHNPFAKSSPLTALSETRDRF